MKEAELDGIPLDMDDFRLIVEFQNDGDYRQTATEDGDTDTETGKWELSGNEVELEYDGGDRWELTIISITRNELRVEDDDDLEVLFEKR